ncbi:hypothetical protein BDV97DRAFT_225526 [Delphinella strobiligena]|nr:hypothetical protein BDV97DRAFT_225526 [Delphinella strobiligena]
MATLSDSSSMHSNGRRKKPVTYGRAARNTAFTAQSVGDFFDQGEHADGATERHPSKTLTRPKTLPKRPIRDKPTPTQDEFDVPVSDDDDLDTTPKPSNPRPSKHSTLSSSTRQNGTLPTRVNGQKRKSPKEDVPAQKRTRTNSPTSPPSAEDNVRRTDTLVTSPSFARQVRHSRVSTKQSNARRSKRATIKTTPVRPGISAPARLSEMLSEASVASNSAESQHLDSDNALPGTSPKSAPIHPPTVRRTASATPKQSQLWSQLLSSDPIEPRSPEPPLEHLRLAPDAHSDPRDGWTESPNIMGSPTDALSRTISRQSRLVDRLKRTAQDFDIIDVERTMSAEDSEHDADESNTDAYARAHVSQSLESQPQQTESQTAASQATLASKMTYARTRSYLQEDTLEDNLMLALPTTAPIRPAASARRVQPSGKGKSESNYDLDEDSDDGVTTGIRSIHELRAAGSKKRFLDDAAALFDDIRDHKVASRSRRRSALIDLAVKLFDKSFLVRFVEHGFANELSNEFSSPYDDRISDFAVCAILALLSALDATDKTLKVLYNAGAPDVAARCLDDTRTMGQVAKDRRSNMSGTAQDTFLDFSQSVRASSLWGEDKPEDLTLRLLGLKSMELMVLRQRCQGNKGSILSTDIVARLVDIVTHFGGSLSHAPLQIITRRLALSVLEFASTSDALSSTWSTELWSQLVTALPVLLRIESESQALVLKLCINLTNNNARNCDICSKSEIIDAIIGEIVQGFGHLHDQSAGEEQKARLDTLILSLGLMINLAEFSDEAGEQVAGLTHNGLPSMVGMFLHGQEKIEQAQSEEETHSNVAYGFLAVLLGNLCVNGNVREEVRDSLPGKTLRSLLAAIDEFAQHNRKVDSQTFENEEGRDVWEHFTERLMAVVKRLQELE